MVFIAGRAAYAGETGACADSRHGHGFVRELKTAGWSLSGIDQAKAAQDPLALALAFAVMEPLRKRQGQTDGRA